MKENKNLGCAEQTATFDMAADRLLSVTANGVEAASADHFVAAVGDATERLRSIAWGIPLRQTADTHWGTVGNWPLWEEYRRHVGRYLVTPDGEARKLNPSHSGYYVDGSEVDESEGNVMVIAPKLHVRVMDDALEGCPVVWMSQQPLGGFALANAAGEWNCYGAYKGTMDGSKLVSRSGLGRPGSKTLIAWWAAAQANGSDWGLFDYDGWRWYCLMCLCESEGWTNIQEALGYGPYGDATKNEVITGDIYSSCLAQCKSGCTKALGDDTASIPVANVAEKSCSVSVCGVENLYGFSAECIQGIYTSGTEPKTAYIYKGNRVPASVADANNPPSGEYRTAPMIGNCNRYSTMLLGAWFDLLPQNNSGSDTTYWCDGGMVKPQGQTFGVGMAVGTLAASGNGPFSAWSYHNVATNGHTARLGYYGHLTFA